MRMRSLVFILMLLMIAACVVGPDYQRPSAIIPISYKEAPEGWKIANPQDDCDRGKWWQIFNDPLLNKLEEQLIISNQNIAAVEAQYRQARSVVAQARAAYYPTVRGLGTFTREQNSALAGGSFRNTSPSTSSTSVSLLPVFNDYNLTLNATWEPDLWGSVRRTVEASVDGAQATAALLALTRLSAQGSLAQYYFELRGLDANQKVLNVTVINYQKLLKITQNQYYAGTVSQANILAVKSQLALAQVQAIDNGILRGQYEHAIAVLIGQPPAGFCLDNGVKKLLPPFIPVQVPSILLERRPDIAQAERLVAQANAQIGVTIAAYFPTLTLTGTGGFESTLLKNLFTAPARFWSVAAGLADVIFDGGLRSAVVDGARANYDQAVALYRQTVLTAFQNVEDNLVALRILGDEVEKQNDAVKAAKQTLDLVINEYKAGTVATSDVLNAEFTLFTAELGANNIAYRRMTAAVGLIQALGGGWDACILENLSI